MGTVLINPIIYSQHTWAYTCVNLREGPCRKKKKKKKMRRSRRRRRKERTDLDIRYSIGSNDAS
jgi:hypothetical protein